MHRPRPRACSTRTSGARRRLVDRHARRLPSRARARLEAGDPDGHPTPWAPPRGRVAAGRIATVAQVPQPAHGRQRIEQGDYLLANDKGGVRHRGQDVSDGYATFGGELLSVDRIGPDGLPLGRSYYIETLLGVSNEMIDPTSVGVLADGADGGSAVVRVLGNLRGIPLPRRVAEAALPRHLRLPAAMDWVLAPGRRRSTCACTC